MKKFFLLSAVALLAVTACTDPMALQVGEEVMLSPANADGSNATRGYVESAAFEDTYCADGSKHDRTMQISAYLYPQDGEQGNYFVDKTFAKSSDGLWHNMKGTEVDPIYWPVGGKLDFLAFSLTNEAAYNKGINVKWDSENAASKVILTVPAENTQNDILFASIANVKAKKESAALSIHFMHAQAWLEFQLSSNLEDVVKVQGIELENAYNAGTLTINNNGGNALAQWNFAGQKVQNIAVDNLKKISKLGATPQNMDMLIPQQPKTAFVLYYTLGSDDQVLSYRFETDQKTWLMGEKYIYKITVNTNEVKVSPEVSAWKATTETESMVKVEYDDEIGEVEVKSLDEPATKAQATATCSTWGGHVELKATVKDEKAMDWRFEKWSDGSTENPHTVVVTEDVTYKAFFTNAGIKVSAKARIEGRGTTTINGKELETVMFAKGDKVTLNVTPAENYTFVKWINSETKETVSTNPEFEITVGDTDEKYSAILSFSANLAFNYADRGIVKNGNKEISGDFAVSAVKATLSAEAKTGWQFYKWTVTVGETTTESMEATVDVTEPNTKVKAYFIPADAIKSEFTVSESGKKVVFAKGNLKATYDGEKWNFSIASDQKSVVGVEEGTGNFKAAKNDATPDSYTYEVGDAIDLFGWSTTKDEKYYGMFSFEKVTEAVTFKDWGNSIGNEWMTLSGEGLSGDWGYIIKGSRGISHDNYTILGGFGIVFYPDNYSGETVTSADEIPEGCVFLPLAGHTYSGTCSETTFRYWTSSISPYKSDGVYIQAYGVMHSGGDASCISKPVNNHFAVRLASYLEPYED